jgi:hypothetical protein
MSELIEQLSEWTASKVVANPVPQQVLDAMSVLWNSKDYISYIGVHDDNCEVEVQWSSRGCHQSERIEFPLSVLQAADVKKAAKLWKAREAVRTATEEKESAERELMYKNEHLEKLLAELRAIEAST